MIRLLTAVMDDSMAKFSLLAAEFGRAVLVDEYDPWTYVDSFGRSRIYKSLLSSYKAATIAPSVSVRTVEESMLASVLDKSALTIPSSTKRRRSGSVGSRSTTSSVGSALDKGPLKLMCTFVFMYTVFKHCSMSCAFL